MSDVILLFCTYATGSTLPGFPFKSTNQSWKPPNTPLTSPFFFRSCTTGSTVPRCRRVGGAWRRTPSRSPGTSWTSCATTTTPWFRRWTSYATSSVNHIFGWVPSCVCVLVGDFGHLVWVYFVNLRGVWFCLLGVKGDEAERNSDLMVIVLRW